MVITTSRLRLRPWEEADAADLFVYASDERVGPIAGWPPHTSVEDSARVIRDVLSAPETYAVCLRDGQRPIGSVGIMVGKASNLGLTEREGEVGYWIGVPFWGRGLIPEAVRAIISHAFCDLGLETLWCAYFEGNDRSRRVAEKCGFTYHHTNEDVAWELMGDVRTEHAMRLTRRDWVHGLAIRWLDETERGRALDLAWRVFLEFNAEEDGARGCEEFHQAIHDEGYLKDLTYLGAFDEGALVAMVAYHPGRHHICLCFVDGRYHRLGIGTRLVRLLMEDVAAVSDACGITLNASPAAMSFWWQMGFEATGPELVVHGIRFVPMSAHTRPTSAKGTVR